MRIYTSPQGSIEWLQDRCGITTASMFFETRKRINGLNDKQALYAGAILDGKDADEAKEIAGYTAKPRITPILEKALNGEVVGEFTDKAKSYAFDLAMERISGVPTEQGFSPWQAERGQIMEAEARRAYEKKQKVLVEVTCFITTEPDPVTKSIFGASSDGIDSIKRRGLEIKCFLSRKQIEAILINGDLSEVMDQIQGNIWIGEMDSLDFVLYIPGLKKAKRDVTIITVERDEDYIAALKSDLELFEVLINDYEMKLRGENENI